MNMLGAVYDAIEFIGDDPEREGIEETPARVVKSWKELFSGYKSDPKEHLKKKFPIEGTQMVSLNGIEFFSTCEHHMLPFFGTVDVCYIADGTACGLSKLARVVDGFARRMQMQENLTRQIASAIDEALSPIGVAVRVKGIHMCMRARGVRSSGNAEMVTTHLTGLFLKSQGVKAEWLSGLPH